MTLIDDIQEKTHREPSAAHSEPNPEFKTSSVTLRPSFRIPFSSKAVGRGSDPGKLSASLMITTLLCLATLGAASPLISSEKHRPAEFPHISPEEHCPAEIPHITPKHPAYPPKISQLHHQSEEEEHHRPEQPAYRTSFPQPRHELRQKEQGQSFGEHRPEEQYHSGEQYRPEEYHTEYQHHPENHPEVHIWSSLPQFPGAHIPSTPCPPSLEGQWNCMLTSWQRCGSGIWSAVMPTAKGTQCAPGGIAARLKTVNAPEYLPAAEPEQPQPQGNIDSRGQGLPPRYNAGGRLGMSRGLAGAAVAVAVMIGGLA